jgi:hypothetical protein
MLSSPISPSLAIPNGVHSAQSMPVALVASIESILSSRFKAQVAFLEASQLGSAQSFSKTRTHWRATFKANKANIHVHLRCAKSAGRKRRLDRHLSSLSPLAPAFYGVAAADGVTASIWEFREGRSDATFDDYTPDELAGVAESIAEIGVRALPLPKGVSLPVGMPWITPVSVTASESPCFPQSFRSLCRDFSGLEPAIIAHLRSLPCTLLTHNDLKAPNVIISDNAVATIVDWDSASVGPPGASLRRFSQHGPKTERIVVHSYVRRLEQLGTSVDPDLVRFTMRAQEIFWALTTSLRHKHYARAVNIAQLMQALVSDPPVYLLKL